MSETTLEALLQEGRTFPPSKGFQKDALITDANVYDEAERDWQGFWARQALALGFQREVVRNVLSHLLTPGVAEFRQQERMSVELLAAVAIEAVASNEIGISPRAQVCVVGNDEAARAANRFAGGRAQTRHEPSTAFDGEMVHQVVAQDAFLVAHALGKQRRAGIEQDACGLQGSRG